MILFHLCRVGTLKISPFGYCWHLANNNIHLLLVGEITGSSFNVGKLYQGRESLAARSKESKPCCRWRAHSCLNPKDAVFQIKKMCC